MIKRVIVLLLVLFLAFANNLWMVNAENDIKYSIQTGVFQKDSNAKKMYDFLLEKGFQVYEKQSGSKTYIRLGQYDSKGEAKTVLKSLKTFDIGGYIIEEYAIDTVTHDDDAKVLNSSVAVKNYAFGPDVQVSGVFQSYEYYFNTANYWDIQDGCFLELVFSRTDLEIDENSTLSLLINDYPIYSTYIARYEKYKACIKIPIPKEKINEGFNEITLKTYQRITDDSCEDRMNPANYLVYHAESYVHIEYHKAKDSSKIKG
jgi:hypothetical protein